MSEDYSIYTHWPLRCLKFQGLEAFLFHFFAYESRECGDIFSNISYSLIGASSFAKIIGSVYSSFLRAFLMKNIYTKRNMNSSSAMVTERNALSSPRSIKDFERPKS